MRELDIKTRGVYIALACDIERMMDDIVTYIEQPDFSKQLEYKKDKIMSLEMGKKVARTIASLKEYNINYYDQYSKELAIIEEIVTYRNVMAHGYSEYDPKEQDERYITYYNKEKSNIVKYVIEPREFIKNMKLYQETLLKIVNLIQILSEERGRPFPPQQP